MCLPWREKYRESIKLMTAVTPDNAWGSERIWELEFCFCSFSESKFPPHFSCHFWKPMCHIPWHEILLNYICVYSVNVTKCQHFGFILQIFYLFIYYFCLHCTLSCLPDPSCLADQVSVDRKVLLWNEELCHSHAGSWRSGEYDCQAITSKTSL